MSDTVDKAAPGPLRLLALDGGGVRGLSELLVLQEVMRRIKHAKNLDKEPLPCEYFDLIGGTSTGGLIALLLGRLKLSAESAKNAYLELAGTVFSERKWKFQDGTFKASKLEEAIQQKVEQALGQGSKNARMIDPKDKDPRCKVFVCAVGAPDTAAAVGPTLFRTYEVVRNRSDDCMIWEAGRATSAAPTFFKRIYIGNEGAKVAYLDAGLGYNNPISQVLNEALDVFGTERQLGCIVSLGTGESDAQDYKQPDWFEKIVPVQLVKSLETIATNTARVAQDYERKFQGCPHVYFRLNVRRSIGRMALDEWRKLPNISYLTGNYLKEAAVSCDVDRLVQLLIGKSKESTVSLEAVGMHKT
ncbi:FabD/lysophospholipase-like protein [Lentithecium fluviatile CBS 122367]|uniref:FabD/lysophospholipase-like protein n=1 Tax=Lentithecium fluviatile CBS 122367 TaxID=1168545 RepID=A0A6G1IF30_9PLEO|nr:FabD/lysophospholipase-like protein [Lentithecium fluviatile CBS 122367]